MRTSETMTIVYQGVNIEVEFYYYPGKPDTFYKEGYPDEIEICGYMHCDEDITDLIDAVPGSEKEIENLIFENYTL